MTGLPDGDRERVTHLFEHYGSLQDELQPRIERAFRNLGYFKARVDEPKISVTGQRQRTEDVDVSVKVDQGARYRLGEIQFQKASLFPADQCVRSLKSGGDLLRITKITQGLDERRKLYY
jgi:outer membrane protein assembly factor BamA